MGRLREERLEQAGQRDRSQEQATKGTTVEGPRAAAAAIEPRREARNCHFSPLAGRLFPTPAPFAGADVDPDPAPVGGLGLDREAEGAASIWVELEGVGDDGLPFARQAYPGVAAGA